MNGSTAANLLLPCSHWNNYVKHAREYNYQFSQVRPTPGCATRF